MSKKIAVIGGGIAGLSAGCYARMNGFDVEIFEKHTVPGGLCTAWKRGEYTFEGCIHWLTGSTEDGLFFTFWNELGALKGKTIVDHDEFFRKEFPDGTVVRFFTDADKLEEHLLLISPADEKPIRRFCDAVRKLAALRFPMDKPFMMMGFFDVVKMIVSMMPYGKVMKFADSTTVGDFADQFASPYLRESFTEILYDETMSLSAILFTFAGLHNRSSGYPVGGSPEFAKGIEKRFLDLGGTIRYKTPVAKIKLDGGKAAGWKDRPMNDTLKRKNPFPPACRSLWVSTPENQKILRQIPYQLPDIDNLYFAGMWMMAPGGLPTGAKTSRDILQLICKRENREFTTTTDM